MPGGRPASTSASRPGGGRVCDVNLSKVARVTCEDIPETDIRVVGSDHQMLDLDGNGVACEDRNNQPNPHRTPEENAEFEKWD